MVWSGPPLTSSGLSDFPLWTQQWKWQGSFPVLWLWSFTELIWTGCGQGDSSFVRNYSPLIHHSKDKIAAGVKSREAASAGLSLERMYRHWETSVKLCIATTRLQTKVLNLLLHLARYRSTDVLSDPNTESHVTICNLLSVDFLSVLQIQQPANSSPDIVVCSSSLFSIKTGTYPFPWRRYDTVPWPDSVVTLKWCICAACSIKKETSFHSKITVPESPRAVCATEL